MRKRSKFYDRRQRRPNTHDNRGVHLRGLPIFGMLLLAGCSLAPVIAGNSLDYNTTVETVTNSVLVTNILRARDGAPLYFSDLSQIRGAVQLNLTAAQTTVPYGPVFPAAGGAFAQAGPLAVNSQPNFDFAPLNTKKFAEGMLEGIDPKVFAYFIQRDINAKVFLNLVVFRIEAYHKIGKDKNTGEDKYDILGTCVVRMYEPRDHCRDLIKSWTDKGQQPYIGLLSKETKFGPLIPAEILAGEQNALRNLVQVNTADLDLDAVKITGDDHKLDPKLPNLEKAYQLSKTTNKFVLCIPSGPDTFDAVGIAVSGAIKEPKKAPIPTENGTCGNKSSNPLRYVIYTRSVEAIFYYLGALLLYPQNSPFAFHIYDHSVEGARFHTDYRGKTYFVSEAQGGDYTVSVLAILNDLLNLSRDATEIPSTKTVATTP